MTTLTITRGLPGAGKTTWARQHAAESGALRINRDDMRMMMFGRKVGLDHKAESTITNACHALARVHLEAGRDVVADDTNLRPAYVRQWRKLASQCGAGFRVVELPMSLDEVIQRNLDRPGGDRVPEDVLRDMAARFLPRGEFLPVPNESEPDALRTVERDTMLRSTILCDIDGTVALMGDRSPYDTSQVGEDEPNHDVIGVLLALADHHHVVFMSGRDESCRADTEQWLRRHVGIHGWGLHMRPAGDRRRDSIVKAELFDQHIRGRFDVIAVLDDRQQVVDMWRELGLTCLQVAPGDF